MSIHLTLSVERSRICRAKRKGARIRVKHEETVNKQFSLHCARARLTKIMGNEQSTPGATSSSPDAASSAHASPLQAAADARDVAWSPCATAKNACPAPRVGAGAVLDDGTLVVIGGHSNEEEFGDVWALGAADETQWVKREPAGQAPRVRGGHSVVYLTPTMASSSLAASRTSAAATSRTCRSGARSECMAPRVRNG